MLALFQVCLGIIGEVHRHRCRIISGNAIAQFHSGVYVLYSGKISPFSPVVPSGENLTAEFFSIDERAVIVVSASESG